MIKDVFMCECHCCGVIVETFKGEPQIYLQKLGQPLWLNWKRKLETIWKLLTNNYRQWSLDDIIFDKETARKLGEELIRVSNLPEVGQ